MVPAWWCDICGDEATANLTYDEAVACEETHSVAASNDPQQEQEQQQRPRAPSFSSSAAAAAATAVIAAARRGQQEVAGSDDESYTADVVSTVQYADIDPNMTKERSAKATQPNDGDDYAALSFTDAFGAVADAAMYTDSNPKQVYGGSNDFGESADADSSGNAAVYAVSAPHLVYAVSDA